MASNRFRRTSPRTLENNPIGNVNRSGGFNIGGNDGDAGEFLANLGNRLSARMNMNANARAMLDVAKVEAVTKHTIRKMELEAGAAAQAAELENNLKIERAKANGTIRKVRAEHKAKIEQQAQAMIHTTGLLDKMSELYPGAAFDFKTVTGASINVKPPKEASSEDSEGGSLI